MAFRTGRRLVLSALRAKAASSSLGTRACARTIRATAIALAALLGATACQPREQISQSAADNQTAPEGSQRAVLYEEDTANPQGNAYNGFAVWRTETVSPGGGRPDEVAVRADIDIPDRQMAVVWSLRRNTDRKLPASHTIEIRFSLPRSSPGDGIANVPGILLKTFPEAKGIPLSGLSVKVSDGYFLIGLSGVDADRQRNLRLLNDQNWLDVPIVFNSGKRAILAVEKGPSGARVFASAFAAWGDQR
jgi:hypothetical protein